MDSIVNTVFFYIMKIIRNFVVYGCKDFLQLEDAVLSIDTLRNIDLFDYDSIDNPFLLEDIKNMESNQRYINQKARNS